ncbi:hypothetical protein [Flavobacterium sp.]|uniref:hypothetical protein n=1 Tax=Flavobacterium sp. TaxID=239 RepID=UPI0025F8D820|nr:hypothetical protein [Flavobacterium sp.]
MNLTELEKKYAELGAEIESLKTKGKYPIYCIGKVSRAIVRFDDAKTGTVVKAGGCFELGYSSENWTKHSVEGVWERLDVCKETGFYDGQPVWCWDEDDKCVRMLRFYNAIYSCTFSFEGNKFGLIHKNYEAFEGKWFEWMNQAFEKLER